METSPPPTHKKNMNGKNRRMFLVNAVAQRNRRPHAAVEAPERKKPKDRKQGKPKWPFKKTVQIKSKERIFTKSRENDQGKSNSAHFLFLAVSKRRRSGWGLRFSGGLLRWKRRVGRALRKWMSRGRRSFMGWWAPRRRHRDSEIQRLMRNEEEEEEEDEEEERIELCKKRILMGDKCKALSQSGRLHYDENGVLLPEMIP